MDCWRREGGVEDVRGYWRAEVVGADANMGNGSAVHAVCAAFSLGGGRHPQARQDGRSRPWRIAAPRIPLLATLVSYSRTALSGTCAPAPCGWRILSPQPPPGRVVMATATSAQAASPLRSAAPRRRPRGRPAAPEFLCCWPRPCPSLRLLRLRQLSRSHPSRPSCNPMGWALRISKSTPDTCARCTALLRRCCKSLALVSTLASVDQHEDGRNKVEHWSGYASTFLGLRNAGGSDC